MRARHDDLLVVAILSATSAVGILLLPGGVPRFCCAAVLLLCAPGYALTAALFPPGSVTGAVRLLSCVLLAIATLATGSVLVHATTVPLGRPAWTTLALAVTAAACVVAFRRRGAHGTVSFAGLARPRVRRLDAVLLVLALVAASAGVAISRTPLPAKEALGYTQLWMLPGVAGPGDEVVIGIRSAEKRSQAYRLELVAGEDRRVIQARIVLAPGRQYQQRLRLPDAPALSPEPADGTILTAELYRLDRVGDPYRRVTIKVASR